MGDVGTGRTEAHSSANMLRPKIKVEELLGSFEGKIRRVHTSIFYKLGMLLVALAMVALLLVYLGLVAAVGYGIYLYAINNVSILKEIRGFWGGLVILTVYLGPLACGAATILFTLKPLLARRNFPVPPRALKPEDELLLYAFVEKLCQVVRAPMPRRIQVDFEVNASAGPRYGLMSILFRSMTLTIGLPLVAGLEMRQLAGVLAHELGHFSQGGGMFLGYLIRRINIWFARAVYERDGWDVSLERSARESQFPVNLVFQATRLCIWLTRRVLWVLMHLGNFFSSFLARQKEFDADCYEARVVGSDTFERTMIQLHLLDLAAQKARNDLTHALDEKRLGDDLPALIAANLEAMPAEIKQEYTAHIMNQKAGVFDTHPASAARISQTLKENAPGVFHDARPAAFLFSNFEQLCKAVSMDLYAMAFGGEVVHSRLIPTSELLARRREMAQTQDAISRFFHDYASTSRPMQFTMGQFDEPRDPLEMVQELKKAREHFEQMSSGAQEAFEALESAEREEMNLALASELIRMKMSFKARDFGLKKARAEEIQARLVKVGQIKDDAEMIIMPIEDAMKRRLVAAIRLLYLPQVRQRVPEAEELLKLNDRLVDGLAAFASVLKHLNKMRVDHRVLHIIALSLKGRQEFDQDTYLLARKAMRHLVQDIELIHALLKLNPYPFSHGSGEVSLGHYILNLPVDRDDAGDMLGKGSEMLDRLGRFYFRVIGTMALTAEKVEDALGLLPIKKVENPESTEATSGAI